MTDAVKWKDKIQYNKHNKIYILS